MRQGVSGVGRLIAPVALLLLAGCATEYPQTMLRPVSDFGHLTNELWGLVTLWTAGITFVVFGALAYILVRFRGREGDPPPRPIYGSTKLEIAWTLGPALIILFISIPTIRVLFETQGHPPEDAMVIEVIGHQWWWEFRYPDQGIVTANQFYVPHGRTIDLQLRSADVIHSFWVPRIGGKRDVNPVVRTPEGVEPLHLNRIVVTVDSAGEYLGQCAEYCGTSHAIMRMMAVVVEPEDFERWVEDYRSPREPPGEQIARGREIFLGSTCIACHAVRGTRAQGRLGPDLTLMGDRFSIGAGLMPNTEENLTEWIMRAPELKKGVVMPGAEIGAGGMPPTGLSREQAAAVAAYLSDLRRPLAGARRPAADTLNGGAPGAEPPAGDTLNAAVDAASQP